MYKLFQANQEAAANPYGDQILMPIQPQVADILISRTSYVKKLLEDCNNSEDTTKLLRVCILIDREMLCNLYEHLLISVRVIYRSPHIPAVLLICCPILVYGKNSYLNLHV
jgi:ubiquitin carboxyl-terminal hydrolase 9/24